MSLFRRILPNSVVEIEVFMFFIEEGLLFICMLFVYYVCSKYECPDALPCLTIAPHALIKTSVLITSISPMHPFSSSLPLHHSDLALSLKYAAVCRYTACLAGGGASPGQTEGAGGGAHRGEAQPAQIRAPEPPVPPDPGLAEVRPTSQRPGKLKTNSGRSIRGHKFMLICLQEETFEMF